MTIKKCVDQYYFGKIDTQFNDNIGNCCGHNSISSRHQPKSTNASSIAITIMVGFIISLALLLIAHTFL